MFGQHFGIGNALRHFLRTIAHILRPDRAGTNHDRPCQGAPADFVKTDDHVVLPVCQRMLKIKGRGDHAAVPSGTSRNTS